MLLVVRLENVVAHVKAAVATFSNHSIGCKISKDIILGPKLFFVRGLVIFVTAVARLVCLDLLGLCLSRFANINFGPSLTLTPNATI